MAILSPTNKKINIFSLIMITVIATDSLRNIPISAQYGYYLIFFYILAAITFMLPSAFATAELVSAWPEEGGVYLWVKKAFGAKIGFLTIWLQWVYNICWYPTILALLAATLAYLIDPSLADNKLYTFIPVNVAYWLITWINSRGISASSKMSSFTAIVGTIIPMIFICILCFWWLKSGNTPQINFGFNNIMPNMKTTDNWILLSNILYSLIGVEISAYHVKNVKNPKRNYPIALFSASAIILISLIFSSLAVAAIIPEYSLKNTLNSGLLDAFALFFSYFNLQWIMPIISILIIIGIIGGVGAWIIGPSKGLLLAANDIDLPKIFKKQNKAETPIGILIIQGIIFSILSFMYIAMPSVNSAFFILSILTAQLALISYIFLFAAYIKLRYKYPDVKRPFETPGGTFGVWILGIMAILTCVVTILLSFLPPDHINLGDIYLYESYLIISFIIFIISPFFIAFFSKKVAKVANS